MNNNKYYAFYNEISPDHYQPLHKPGTFVSVENIFQQKIYGTHIVLVTIPKYYKIQYNKSTLKYYSAKYTMGDLMKFTEISTIQMLIDNGANIEKCGNLLCWFAANNHLNLIKYIIKISETIDNFNNMDTLTRYRHIVSTQNLITETKYFDRCLLLAIKNGHLDIVKYLFNNENNKSGEKLYIWVACISGHLHIFKYFIEMGFDVSFDNNIYLMSAIFFEKNEIVKYIESYGIKICDQITKCIYLVINGQHNDFFKLSMKVKFLVTVGVNRHTLYQILLSMCEMGCYNTVKYLMKSGIKPTDACLKIAHKNGNIDVIKILTNYFNNINKKN
ncbi:ankyrin repeat protein [Cotonvirus japonicus]|uniref:Ankyrin repeat protein n=1 Tax=Cotonvirus japonicus TaxID=2811091 RepID=A0ABM7NRM6_9VIRU|nr:ankyrin repeat protein [Cotonvirus japonicus]BCS82810.1 ankyrin repeat protein [Cotonvirus japonicus]